MPWWKTRAYREQLTDYLNEDAGRGQGAQHDQQQGGTRIVDETGGEWTEDDEAELPEGIVKTAQGTLRFVSPQAAGFTVETVTVGQD